ncbi:hypothetical protein [Bradyrhizobium sp. GM2.2]|uniref:hypothetical protein n=1 Tax=Bradyrhizobium sp. GM2.2 TaxID=3156358 RepID=UPI003399F135
MKSIGARYVRFGQEVEFTFKFVPAHVYTGKVESIVQAIAAGQTQTSGTANPRRRSARPRVSGIRYLSKSRYSACYQFCYPTLEYGAGHSGIRPSLADMKVKQKQTDRYQR